MTKRKRGGIPHVRQKSDPFHLSRGHKSKHSRSSSSGHAFHTSSSSGGSSSPRYGGRRHPGTGTVPSFGGGGHPTVHIAKDRTFRSAAGAHGSIATSGGLSHISGGLVSTVTFKGGRSSKSHFASAKHASSLSVVAHKAKRVKLRGIRPNMPTTHIQPGSMGFQHGGFGGGPFGPKGQGIGSNKSYSLGPSGPIHVPPGPINIFQAAPSAHRSYSDAYLAKQSGVTSRSNDSHGGHSTRSRSHSATASAVHRRPRVGSHQSRTGINRTRTVKGPRPLAEGIGFFGVNSPAPMTHIPHAPGINTSRGIFH